MTTANAPPIAHGQALALRDMTPNRQIVLQSPGREYLVSAADIVQWVAPNAPINEAKKFLLVCQILGLNPLLGEIDLLPWNKGAKWGAVVRKNGYVNIARRSKEYDGHESGVTVQPTRIQDKVKVANGPMIDVPGTIVPPGCLLVGGWAKFFRKGISRPVYKRVSLSEYDKGTGTWETIKCTMIEKCAIAAAAREAFSIADSYDESEYPNHIPPPSEAADDYAPVEIRPALSEPSPEPIRPPHEPMAAEPEPDTDTIDVEFEEDDPARPAKCTSDQAMQIANLIVRLNMPAADQAKMLDRRNVSSITDLDPIQAQDIINKLEEIASRREWNPLGAAPTTTPAGPAHEAPEATDPQSNAAEVAAIQE